MRTFPIFVSFDAKPPLVVGGGELSTANHKRPLCVEADKDGKCAHQLVLPTGTGSAGCSVRLSGASSISSPSSSGFMMSWQHSRERSST